jgi:hypothetical protein
MTINISSRTSNDSAGRNVEASSQSIAHYTYNEQVQIQLGIIWFMMQNPT